MIARNYDAHVIPSIFDRKELHLSLFGTKSIQMVILKVFSSAQAELSFIQRLLMIQEEHDLEIVLLSS